MQYSKDHYIIALSMEKQIQITSFERLYETASPSTLCPHNQRAKTYRSLLPHAKWKHFRKTNALFKDSKVRNRIKRRPVAAKIGEEGSKFESLCLPSQQQLSSYLVIPSKERNLSDKDPTE